MVVGNTLTNPSTSYDGRGLLPTGGSNVWYTPLYFQDVWEYRKLFARMDVMMKSAPVPAKVSAPKEEPEAPPPAAPELNETKTGQLTLF